MRQSPLLPAFLPALLTALLFTTPALAQHETGADLFSGEQVWQNLCANCHGLDGGLVPNVDLGHGVFRQDYSDEQLIALIQNGIPNTPMPPNPTMSTEQAQLVVNFLRSRAVDSSSGLAGNSANGRELFIDRGSCIACHMVNGEGEPTGPDLSRIGDLRTAAELTQSLRAPDAVIQPNHRHYSVTTQAGTSISGRLMNQDVYTVQLLDGSGKLRSFTKADLTEHGFAPSPMGALATDDWSDQEVADLVAYLASLRAPVTAGATP
jgi:putative heme-binding domain-containing protein